jgi:hypothetical protein
MNKITKLGVSALCGTLAAVSAANAGSMSVAGSANATWTSKDGSVNGNPLGMSTGLTFSGSGELDNGNAIAVNIYHDDQNAFSTADMSVDVAGIGKISLDQGGGTGMDRLDDKMPTAWEESYDTGVGTGIQTVVGVGGGTDIEWAISDGLLPDGLSAYVSWTPEADGTAPNDKSSGGATTTDHEFDGFDIVLEHSGLADGLNVFGGYSHIDQIERIGDRTTTALGFTYAIGSITVGYQISKDNKPGVIGSTAEAYENQAYGVSFAVNDSLSLSYGTHESEQKTSLSTATEVKSESFQVAYSMGGATIKLAESQVDNASYSTAAANDKEARTIALTLAF